MKNLMITLVAIGALMLPKPSDAQRQRSELNLKMYDNSFFTVVFDRRIYDSPSAIFRLSNITPGSHRLVVKQQFGGRHGTLRTIYNGFIEIPGGSKVNAKINRYNRLVIGNIVNKRNHYHSNRNYNRHYNKPQLDMHRLQQSLRHAKFENDKRIIAEEAVSSHRVKANQIYRIMMMFSFESTKLKVAKYAYRYCDDKTNYYIVNDAFSFSSSRRELNNYIGNFRSEYYDNDWNSRSDYQNNNYYNHR